MMFDQIWDLIKNDQRMAPSWMKEEESPYAGDVEITGVGMNEIPPQGNECCEDLRTELIRLDNKYKGTAAELIFEHTQFLHDESCEDLEEALNDQIGYADFLLKDYFGKDASAEGDFNRQVMRNMSEDPAAVIRECLDELRQAKVEYEACKGTQFGDVNHLDFTASEDSFERTWDLLMKAPLDFDSIKPVAYVAGDEESDKMMYAADFVHPTTKQRYPINISTPSLSHDFEVRVEYPPAEEGYFPEGDFFGPGDSRLDNPRDPVIGGKAAQANVHYHPDYEPNEGDYDLSFMYPPSNSIVGISPYVAAEMRGAGIGSAIYDFIRALGYRIKPSRNLSDAGEAMWRKNQGRDIEDQSEWRGMRERDE